MQSLVLSVYCDLWINCKLDEPVYGTKAEHSDPAFVHSFLSLTVYSPSGIDGSQVAI